MDQVMLSINISSWAREEGKRGMGREYVFSEN